jgi:hypothetical protein
MAQKLPIGLQDFRTIISENFKYVDKTRHIHDICTSGKFFFLSRPRRFGKSITIATLQELYSGSKELFRGLWIEDKWDWSRRHPVVRISLKDVNFEQRGLEDPLSERILEVATSNQISLRSVSARDRFRELILARSTEAKVVVLVDEYDAPIVHYLGKDTSTAYQNRELLKGFYSVLKELDAHLEFVFLTGVSKFSKVGIFSGLNNLQDITMHPRFATMLGYTQEELETNFAAEIVDTAAHLRLSQAELLEKMRFWYNGYRFEQDAPTVYNPVSANTFFSFQKFENFWFATGTPTFLINLLKQEGLYDLQFDNLNPMGFDSFELDNLKPAAILYQTGYLTIREGAESGLLTLDYPNKEVRDAMLEHLIEGFVGVDTEFSAALIIKLRKAFLTDDLEQVFRILQGVFRGLPYQLYEKTPERFYHAAVHLLFTYLGLRVHSEVCTSDGRADCVVETDSRVYILEFKLDESAEVALAQIRQKKYYQAWWNKGKPVTGLGVNFSSETRNIAEWKAEEMH